MQCVTPMVRVYQVLPPEVKENEPDIKPWQKIITRHEVFRNLEENPNYLSIIQDKNQELEKLGRDYRYQLIPCRHCWACQLKYAAQWATRIVCECKRHTHNYFITLTYDEEHLPIMDQIKYIDYDGQTVTVDNDGTWTEGCLNPTDVSRFINTLRKNYERNGITDIKYFYAGEYGTGEKKKPDGSGGKGRPHYHMILMGAPLDVKKFYDLKYDSNKCLHWKSKELENWWGKGIIDVAEVEWGSACYVARYCMKKVNNENDPREYAKQGKVKEFVRMSRRPSIGRIYWEQNKDHLLENDEIIQKNVHGKITPMPIPDAWMKLLKEENPQMYESIKISRQNKAERARKAKQALNDGLTDLEVLNFEAEKILRKGKLLKRE